MNKFKQEIFTITDYGDKKNLIDMPSPCCFKNQLNAEKLFAHRVKLLSILWCRYAILGLNDISDEGFFMAKTTAMRGS